MALCPGEADLPVSGTLFVSASTENRSTFLNSGNYNHNLHQRGDDAGPSYMTGSGNFGKGEKDPLGGVLDSDMALMPLLVKAGLLVLLLVVIVVTNVVLVLKVTRRGRKWTASDRLLKTLAVIGVLNGLVNVIAYLITTCSGRWVLGSSLCQLHGVFGTVIINSWTWILALASFERFVKLLVPSEHASFFSEVNTKIMSWGAILLLLVMYLGPVYGWGEYSFLRGKLDLSVSYRFSNASTTSYTIDGTSVTPLTSSTTTSTTSAGGPRPPHQAPNTGKNQAAMSYLAGLLAGGAGDPLLTATSVNLTRFFEETRQIHLRKPRMTPQAVILPMRATTRRALKCLWAEFKAGWLEERLQGVVAPDNGTLAHFGLPPEFEVSVSIQQEEYVVYNDVHMPYQEGSSCSLDYSNVNEHVYSFVGFTWLCNLLLPLAVMTYCYVRIFTSGLQKLCMFSRDGVTPEDATWCRVFAYAGFTSMLCHLPYTLTNLAAGCGVYVPTNVHFTATYLLYLSTCLTALFYLCATRATTDDFDDRSSCCAPSSNLLVTCLGTGSGSGSNLARGTMGGMFGEIHQRLLHSRPGSASSSPYRPTRGAHQMAHHRVLVSTGAAGCATSTDSTLAPPGGCDINETEL